MKNKIVLTAAFFAASTFSFAEIALTENLSVGGFVDMSYTHSDDERNSPDSSDSNNSYTLDQVDLTFGLDYGVVTAQIDIEWTDANGSAIDQAFTTYDLGNGFVVTAGRYDSMLGFEAFEAPGLYQYSKAYATNTNAFQVESTGTKAGVPVQNAGLPTEIAAIPAVAPTNPSDVGSMISPETNNGVKVTYDDGTQFFGISLQDGGIFGDNRLGGDSAQDASTAVILESMTGILVANQETSGYAVELGYARDLGNGFNVFVGALIEETEVDDTDAAAGAAAAQFDVETSIDTTVYNAYVTYETGAWLFAAEVIQTEHEVSGFQNDVEIDSFLLMANYTYSDQASVTARISNIDVDNYFDATKLTVAHLYAITDNLAVAAEISSIDYDYERGAGSPDGDTLEAAVELLFTF